MQLKKQIVKQNTEIAHAFSQITFDDDYIVKDNKPDVIKIICSGGRPEIEETRVMNEAVWITGKMNFEVLYRGDGDQIPENIKGSIPFQEKLNVQNLSETDRVKTYCQVEDLTIATINSRKLSIRGLMNVEVIAEEAEEIELSYGIEDGDCEQQVDEEIMLCLQTMQRDILRIHNEFSLAKSKPNIESIICDYIDVRNIETGFNADKLLVQGEAHICLMYRSEDRQTEWVDEMIPFSGAVACENVVDPQMFWARVEVAQQEIEAETDYDKEMRQFGLDLVLNVDVKAWREEKITILKDVYSLQKNIEPLYRDGQVWQLQMKNIAKYRIQEQLHIDPLQEKIMQICGCRSSVEIERTKITEQGVWVEGVLTVHMLYITTDDGFPIAHQMDQIPFEQVIDAAGIDDRTKYEIQAGVDQLQVNLLDNSEYELKAVISLGILALQKKKLSIIEEIREVQEAQGGQEELPGIVGYVVQEKESLWDIAKRYHTTVADIVETNGMKSPKAKAGDRIIVVKSFK